MEKVAYTITQNGVTVFLERPTTISKSDERYGLIINALKDDPSDTENIEKIISGNIFDENINKVLNEKGFCLSGGVLRFEGRTLPEKDKDRLLDIVKNGLDIQPFINFINNLYDNPSNNSVEQLYQFLGYKDLPITENGFVIAYKGVDRDFYSIRGNKETKVIQGIVDGQGRILNKIGNTVEVCRNDVNDDPNVHCSHGLHIGSLDYASDWGAKTLVVKFNPADAVSVPTDCSFQKLRVCKYTVIGELEREIVEPVTDGYGRPLETTEVDLCIDGGVVLKKTAKVLLDALKEYCVYSEIGDSLHWVDLSDSISKEDIVSIFNAINYRFVILDDDDISFEYIPNLFSDLEDYISGEE